MASRVPESDVPKYEGAIKECKEKIKKLKAWKGKVAASTPEFEEELEEALYIFNSLFEILQDDQRFFGPAEEMAESIVEMRNHLGKALMPLDKHFFFRRGFFQIGNQTILSAQYFEEIPFYGPPRPCGGEERFQLTKFFEWKLVNCPRENITPSTRVECTYYLEKGIRGGSPYYVLGMSAPRMHATLESFIGVPKPSFFEIEAKVARHVIDKQRGMNPGFAAASYRRPQQ